jgi:undecaprenyl diphosphate synthase
MKAKAIKIPEHIAVVMDGNNRWARQKGLPKMAGHKRGSEVARDMVKWCKKIGVKYLTLYAFSIENWNRPKTEVVSLMALFKRYLKTDINDLMKEDVKIRFIGNRSFLDKEILKLIDNAETKTAKNSFNLVIALSYSGREEITNAAVTFAKDAQSGKIKEVQPSLFQNYLYTKDIPDPDLFIRTSGEFRISNFLLWQIAYTELYFTDILWPDFNEKHLLKAIKDYGERERRYGLR